MYPTQENILENIEINPVEKYFPEALTITKEWKKRHFNKQWGTSVPEQKQKKLRELILNIWEHARPGEDLTISWKENFWYFSPQENRINGDPENPSIISALHELGHSLYGSSELRACAFSVNIFQTVFPKQFAKLTWKEHTLVKLT